MDIIKPWNHSPLDPFAMALNIETIEGISNRKGKLGETVCSRKK